MDPRSPRRAAPPADRSAVALIIIDMINPLDFEGSERLHAPALAAAAACAALRERAHAAGAPVIYANDNFNQWHADWRAVVARARQTEAGRALVEQLEPDARDHHVLKPLHSIFRGTTLALLLDHLRVKGLILTGLAGDICVHFSAVDAYMRGFHLWLPRDCVASEEAAHNDAMLDYSVRVLRAETAPSTELDVEAYCAALEDEEDEA